MAQLQAIDIPAPHGRLEGLLRLPDAAEAPPRMAAVVCHALPTAGGNMHFKVIFRIAQALGQLGMPVLRFNFRGVGRSTGAFDEGRGEADDVHSALDELARRYPALPLCVAGFSFGAKVGLPVGCADARVRQIIGAGVPVELLDVDTLAGCDKPKLIVQGERDQYGPLPKLRDWFARLSEPKALAVVPAADHFFAGQQPQLAQALLAYFHSGASALGPLPEGRA